MCHSLGPLRSKSLLAFHSITGCDQTSAFANRGKKTAWAVWEVYEEVTPTLHALKLVSKPERGGRCNATNRMLYRIGTNVWPDDKAGECRTVNNAGEDLFTRKGRSLVSIPPTSASLIHHVKRSAHPAGYQWGWSLVASPHQPCPDNWGWVKGPLQTWEPCWTLLSSASKICQELLKCGCNPEKGCRGECKCVRANMLCTALCICGGDCDCNQVWISSK